MVTKTSRAGGPPSVTGCVAVATTGTTRTTTAGRSTRTRAAGVSLLACAHPSVSAGRGAAASRRPAPDRRGPGGAEHFDPSGYDQDRGYEPSPRGYGERRPGRGYDRPRRESTEPARGGSADLDATQVSLPRAAGVRAGAPARRAGSGFGTSPGAAPYDTGPAGRVADFTPAVNADPDLADSDVFPRVRADIPEPLPPPSKPAKRLPAKGRGRPLRGKHDDDDDDWPSTEWDHMSDEQYWAELSADKPLATTARTAQPSSAAKPGAAKPGAAKPGAARPGPGCPGSGPGRPGRPGRPAGRGKGGRVAAAAAAEPDVAAAATQKIDLDGRGRRRGRQADTSRPAGPVQPPEPARQPAQPGTAGVTERLPVRPRQRPADTAAYARPADTGTYSQPTATGSGMYAAARTEPGRSRAAGQPRSAGDGYPAPVQADNDPLTSPSFSRQASPADDSRSYRNPGRSQRDRSAAASDRPPAGAPSAPSAASGGYGRPADRTVSYPSPASNGGFQAAGQERTDPGLTRPADRTVSYPSPASNGGYQAAGQERTDPGLTRPVAGGPPPTATSSGGYPNRQQTSSGGYPAPPQTTPSGGYQAPPQTSSGGYPTPPRTPSGGYQAPPQTPSGGYPTPPRTPSGGYQAPPQTPSGGYQAPPQTSSGGYPPAASAIPPGSYPTAPPASPAASPPAGWESEDRRPSPVSSSQTGPGNPYGSFVDSAPPSQAGTGPAQYPQQGQTTPDSGYPASPAASYPNPYEQPAARPPAPEGTWYPAPPPAPAAPAAPVPGAASGQAAGAYPYGGEPATADRARHRSTAAQDNGYPEAYPAANQDGAGHAGGYRADPYGRDGYGGYHSRQS